MVRPGQAAEPLPIDDARQLTKPFPGDDALVDWTARMMRDAKAYQKNRPQDHLGNLFVMNLK